MTRPHPDWDEECQALVQLHHRIGGDSVRLWRWLTPHGGSAQRALHTLQRQRTLPGVQSDPLPRVSHPQKHLDRCAAHPITWNDRRYPARLRVREHPPPILYVRGELADDDAHGVAIVGSRRATRWARSLAYQIARDLAARGITVVSGLAHGVDTAAHEGALSAGRTIAVIGTGIDQTYPRENAQLAERIVQQGAIVSQFTCGSPPLPHHFPLRNDTIARMVQAVVVIEAPEKSGALVTAERAAYHGVDVLACPGDAGRPSCAGSNALLRDGAYLVESAEDILAYLDWQPRLTPTRAPVAATLDSATVTPEMHELLQHFAGESASTDELAERTGKSIGAIRSALTELELYGLIVRLEGDRYRPIG